jgi:hypothetical protein
MHFFKKKDKTEDTCSKQCDYKTLDIDLPWPGVEVAYHVPFNRLVYYIIERCTKLNNLFSKDTSEKKKSLQLSFSSLESFMVVS